MALYTSPTLSGYNTSPPPDDGSQTAANQVEWAKIKEKLADPLNTYASAVDARVAAAFTAMNLYYVTDATYGATGNGSTNDAAAIQAALDAAETAGGGTVVIPWPSASYNLGTTGIDIPDQVTLMCQGAPTVTSGHQQFVYSGTGAAIRLKTGEGASEGFSRGISIINAGVRLTAGTATGFRIRHARDIFLQCCAVRMEEDSQIGFHLQGEAGASSNRGVFDSMLQRCMSYAGDAAYTGALHYKLSGTAGDGQCNANVLIGCRGGGSGAGFEVGPSNTNQFLMCELEAITGDGFEFLSGAFENSVHDLYIEAASSWGGVIFNVNSGAQRNRLDGYVPGANVSVSDITLQANNYVRYNAGARTYAATATNNVHTVRLAADSDDRIAIRADGIRMGDGTAAPDKVFGYRDKTVVVSDYTSANPTHTADVSEGLVQSVRLQSGSSGTLTFAAPTGSVSEGDTMIFHILNSSGGAVTLSWNAAFIVNGSFPTSINNSTRITLIVTKISSQWILVATPITM